VSQKDKKKLLKESIQIELVNPRTTKYRRDKQVEGNFATICPVSMMELALICLEGDEKYGYFNWINVEDMTKFKYDTINHIMKHLELYRSGDRSEKHLAKVMWGCMAIIHHDKKCGHQGGFIK